MMSVRAGRGAKTGARRRCRADGSPKRRCPNRDAAQFGNVEPEIDGFRSSPRQGSAVAGSARRGRTPGGDWSFMAAWPDRSRQPSRSLRIGKPQVIRRRRSAAWL